VTSIHHATKAKQSWRTLGRDRQNGKTYRGCSESDFLKAGLLVHIHVCPHDEMYIRDKLLRPCSLPRVSEPFRSNLALFCNYEQLEAALITGKLLRRNNPANGPVRDVSTIICAYMTPQTSSGIARCSCPFKAVFVRYSVMRAAQAQCSPTWDSSACCPTHSLRACYTKPPVPANFQRRVLGSGAHVGCTDESAIHGGTPSTDLLIALPFRTLHRYGPPCAGLRTKCCARRHRQLVACSSGRNERAEGASFKTKGDPLCKSPPAYINV